MPNRILHESIKYCPKMEQLNWFEEVVYHRLTVSVDDYGCLDGRIVLLKNTLFPTREDISKDDIARAIEHMVALGLLRAYEAGGMPYLCFPAWEEEQRVRNKRRKFPAPPDEEEPLAAEDSLSAADGGEFFAGEKHLTASCCQLTAGCPPESNPYPNPYPYPDSNPKFESGSVTNPYPIQAPGACAEERPRAGEQSLRHSLRCDTVPQFSMGASLRSQSSLEMLPASLGSSAAIAPSIRNGRPAAPYGLQYSLAHWAYYGLFRALRAAFVRPTGCAASFVPLTQGSLLESAIPQEVAPPIMQCKNTSRDFKRVLTMSHKLVDIDLRILARAAGDHKAVADHLHGFGVHAFAQLVARLAGVFVGRVALHGDFDQFAGFQRVPGLFHKIVIHAVLADVYHRLKGVGHGT